MGVIGLKEEARQNWKTIAPKILSQAQLETRSKNVDLALKTIADFEGNYN